MTIPTAYDYFLSYGGSDDRYRRFLYWSLNQFVGRSEIRL